MGWPRQHMQTKRPWFALGGGSPSPLGAVAASAREGGWGVRRTEERGCVCSLEARASFFEFFALVSPFFCLFYCKNTVFFAFFAFFAFLPAPLGAVAASARRGDGASGGPRRGAALPPLEARASFFAFFALVSPFVCLFYYKNACIFAFVFFFCLFSSSFGGGGCECQERGMGRLVDQGEGLGLFPPPGSQGLFFCLFRIGQPIFLPFLL